MPNAAAAPEPVEGCGLLLMPSGTFSKVQAVMVVSARTPILTRASALSATMVFFILEKIFGKRLEKPRQVTNPCLIRDNSVTSQKSCDARN